MRNRYQKTCKKIGVWGLALLCSFNGLAQTKSPKNIIVLIGDGMGYNCIEAANYYTSGKANAQAYENFPVMTWQSTYNGKNSTPGATDDQALYYDLEYRSDSAWIDFEWVRRDADIRTGKTHTNGQKAYNSARYTDSAPAATALSTGKKTYDGAINVDIEGNDLTTIAQHALSMGKKAGIVSTVQFSHATPAGFIAHNKSRNNYSELTKEMLLKTKLSVIIGTGHPDYNDDAQLISGQKDYKYVGNEIIWNDLLNGSLALDGTDPLDIDGNGQPDAWTLIQDSIDFAKIGKGEISTPKRLLGIPRAGTTLQSNRSGGGDQVLEVPYNINIPTLKEMSTAALEVLNNENNKGFFIMIEGGAIDWANHANAAGRMIEEMIDFNAAVDEVIAWVEKNGGWDENLVIVTTDHECGYVLGPDTQNETVNNPIDNPIINNGKGNMPGLSYNSLQHTNMLCPVYAKGAGAELLKAHESRTDFYRGRYIDNTDIPRTLFALWPEEKPQIKNFIMMVSDGWGYNQVLATNYYEGKEQTYESFPVVAPMSTFPGRKGNYKAENTLNLYSTGYNSNRAWSEFDYVMKDFTDSAPAASAMASGEKIYDSALNFDIEDTPLTTLPEIATARGKSAGVVSSVELSHATPAGLGGAHNKDRNAYKEISLEMFFDTRLSVIIGAGHPEYDNQGQKLSSPNYTWIGESTWDALRNNSTTAEGKTLKNISGGTTPDCWTLIEDSVDFASIAQGKNIPLRLAGIPKVHETLQAYRANPTIGQSGDLYGNTKFNADDIQWNKNLPQLHHLSLAALNVLNQNKNGFYLMIEGGAIDWCNHANQLGIMIEEQRDFNMAVDSVIRWVEENSNWDETLLVVTGDHECGYLLGPDHKNKTDNSPATNPIVDNGTGKTPGHSYHSGSHTNQLVPLYAKGACAEKFNNYLNNYDYIRGYYLDNTDLAHLPLSIWKELPLAPPNIPTGIDKITDKNKGEKILMAYPTIADDYLNVESSGNTMIEISNLNGQILLKQQAVSGTSTIHLDTLEKGMYIISADGKQAKIVKK